MSRAAGERATRPVIVRRATHRRELRTPLAASLAVVLAGVALLATPGAAQAACITRLPVSYTLKSRFAQAYGRVIAIAVSSRVPAIRNLRLTLYTFAGDLLGRGYRRVLSGNGAVRVKLRFGLQPGAYTLYAQGEPNADPSCGAKHASSVIRFVGCTTSLPVRFPMPPGGPAADYGGYLSFAIASRGPLMRALNVSVSSFAGEAFGTTSVAELFGSVTVNVPLAQALRPGDYTIKVEGWIASQPRSCGPKHAEQALSFA